MSLPPPTSNHELPRYFCGRLIYYDQDTDNRMQWVVYDGANVNRFTSEKAAEMWCLKNGVRLSHQTVQALQYASYKLYQASDSLDKCAAQMPQNDKILTEDVSVTLRRCADRLQMVVNHYIT